MVVRKVGMQVGAQGDAVLHAVERLARRVRSFDKSFVRRHRSNQHQNGWERGKEYRSRIGQWHVVGSHYRAGPGSRPVGALCDNTGAVPGLHETRKVVFAPC
jgi:hypothetical protein